MLVLPQSIALSRRASDAIKAFVASGGAVLAIGSVGQYDGHGRRLDKPSLEGLFASGDTRATALPLSAPGMTEDLRRLAAASGLRPRLESQSSVVRDAPKVKQYLFRRRGLLVAALLAEPSNVGASASLKVHLKLRAARYAYDVGTGAFLGSGTRLNVTVGSEKPTVIAFSRTLLDRAACAEAFSLRACPGGGEMPRLRRSDGG